MKNWLMRKLKLGFAFTMSALVLMGCSSKPVTPIATAVKVSRDPAPSRCRELGPVRGSTLDARAKAEDVLEDMKKDAAQKGANYVVVQQYSGHETSVTGLAYDCP